MIVLGIESSCDETAAAVVVDGREQLSSVINSQVDIHSRYGGVVPELASRSHLESILPVVAAALEQASLRLDDIDLLAVTQGPGLVGSLLVGVSFAKAVAFQRKKPCVGVNHIASHIAAAFLPGAQPPFPFVALVVSGGHTSLFHVSDPLRLLLLGQTRDDAAGEAFDKVAKVLELGYPGGPIISTLAQGGDPAAIRFPRAWLAPNGFDFSFSGIKTAVINYVAQQKRAGRAIDVAELCAGFQEAVVDVLVEKTVAAARQTGATAIAAVGGVASNSRLRAELQRRGEEEGLRVFIPAADLCTDNGAMVAVAGFHKFKRQGGASLAMDVYSRSLFAENALAV